MPFTDVNVGTVANDGTGDTLRVAGETINENFDKAVEGPASSTNNNLVAFDGTTGKLVKDAGVASSAFATSAQGSLADTAVQPGDDADTLGSGAATDGQVLTADGAGNAAWETPSGSGGDVVGPASSVNGNFPAFSGTDGKTLVDSGESPSSFADASHTHSTTDITDLSSYTGFDSRYYTETEVDNLVDDYLPLTGGTVTGAVDLQGQVRTTPGSDLGTTGTLTLDASGASLRSTGTLTGNITFATSNLAAGRSVTVRVVNGATERTLSFPVGWTFVGAKPTSIAASKDGILTITAFGTADADVVAAWAVEE
jgi:hypothetical protein